ncbi:glycosyltransferase family 4 protein [bacterium]|nr:glycosyltransferase family 4 protein [bacterium]
MHVALDTSALDPEFRAHSIRGTGRYVSELFSRLSAMTSAADESSSLSKLSSFRYTELGRGGMLDGLVDYLPAGKTTVRHQLLYPLSLSQPELLSADLLHFPVHADAPTWSPLPFVVTVLDLIPLIFKELYAPKKNDVRFQFARWLELQSIRNARAVFAISENTKDDVHRLLGVKRDKIIVTPLGVDPSFAEEHEKENRLRSVIGVGEGTPVVLYVGGIDQRKNIHFLLEAFAETRRTLAAHGAVTGELPVLVMAGEISRDDQYPQFLKHVADLEIEPAVYSTGYVSDEDLRAFYRESDIFFYPSLYEGFGLPPLEAMASGTPVVCSNTSSLPEVVGEAALQFSPTQVGEATEKLLAVLQSRDLQHSLSERGRDQAARFSWENTARLTQEGYEQVLERSAGGRRGRLSQGGVRRNALSRDSRRGSHFQGELR